MENTRKLCGIVVVFALIFLPQIADAENRLWDSTQLMASLSISEEIVQDISIVGNVTVLWDSASGNVIGLWYFGGSFRLGSWYTINILANVAGGFPSEDVWSFGVSIWQDFNFLNGLLTAFVETDMLFYSDGYVFVGIYALNIHPLEMVNLGFRAEQIDGSLAIGPVVGFTESFFHIEFQHFSTVIGGDSTAFRIAVGLSF